MSLEAGKVIDGKYRLVRLLGAGGMGSVYVAEHLFLKKELALKVLHPELAQRAEASARFQREARATSQIDHENVVKVTDFGCSSDGELYLVMELLSGHTLAAELRERQRLPPTRALFLAAQILRGLEAAHARDVVHRDLKPDNVLIVRGPDGSDLVKLVDFGIAKLRSEGDQRMTPTGLVVGTPLYMAPEQVRGLADLDARADVHAVGVILYELLSGRTPYGGEAFGAIAHEILTGRPPSLAELAPELDQVLVALVMKAFAPERERRFQSARELREALERHLLDRPLPTPPSPYDAARSSQLTDLPRALDTTTLSARRVEPAALRAAPAVTSSPPSTGRPSIVESGRRGGSQIFGTDAAGEVQALELDRPPPAPPVEPPPPPAASSKVALIALPVIALLVAGGWLALHKHAPPPPARVHIQIVDLPSGARVLLDGERSPSSFDLPGSTAPRQLRLEARGYATRLLLLTPDSDQTLDGRLDRSR